MERKIIPAFSFDFLTPSYDFFVELIGYGTKHREKVVDLLQLKPSEKLLDLGCGTGSLLIIAKKKNSNVEMVGIDADQQVLEIAQNKIQENNLDIKLIKSSADKLLFPDSSFDVVVSTLVFHHLSTEVKKGSLREIHRVLSKNGRFLLADFGQLGLLKIIYYLEVLFRIPEAETAKDNVDGKIPEYLKEAGFNFKEVSSRYLGIQFLLATKN